MSDQACRQIEARPDPSVADLPSSMDRSSRFRALMLEAIATLPDDFCVLAPTPNVILIDTPAMFGIWGSGKTIPTVLALADASADALAAERRHAGHLVPFLVPDLDLDVAKLLTVSPPCRAFSTPADFARPSAGRLSEIIHRDAIMTFRREQDFSASATARLGVSPDLPQEPRPTGRGRTTIPSRGERQATLAARAERLRARRSKGGRA